MSARKPNILLWELIKSLTKPELYKFKERAFEKERRFPKYVELFDLIYQQDEYDEDAIRKALDGEPILNHLSRFKNYLYNRILEFIRDANTGEESELHGILEKVRILFYKRLYHHLPLIINRGKSIAYKIEDFHAVRKLIGFEIGILRELFGPKKYNKEIAQLLEEESQAWECETNQVELFRLDAQFQEVWDLGGKERRDFVSEFLENQKVIDSNFSRSSKARIIQLQILWMCSFFLEQYDQLVEGANEIIAVFEESPGLMEDRAMYESLTKAILYSSQIQAYLGNISDAEKQFEKLKTLAEADKKVPQLFLEQETVFSLSISHVLFDRSIGEEAINRFKEAEKTYFFDFNTKSEIKIAHLAASFWLNCGVPQEALPWISRNRNRKKDSVRPDYGRLSRLLFVLCHWSLGNFDVVEREVRSIRTSWGRQKLMNEYFDFFLALFSDLIAQRNPEREIMAGALKALEQKNEIPLWASMRNYFDLQEWIKARLKNSTVFQINSE